MEVTRSNGRLLGQSSFMSLVSLVQAVEKSLHDEKH